MPLQCFSIGPKCTSIYFAVTDGTHVTINTPVHGVRDHLKSMFCSNLITRHSGVLLELISKNTLGGF